MTLVKPSTVEQSQGDALPPGARWTAGAVLAGAIGMVVVLAAVHVTQGTSSVNASDLLRLLVGRGDEETEAVFVASRLPRMLAGLVVGVALGIAGTLLQSMTRNSLAAPDTLGVNDGAYLAVVASAIFVGGLPPLQSAGVAMVGGLAAAGLAMAVSAGGASGPTRLILAGSATAMAMAAMTNTLLLMKPEETFGLYAWGKGSLAQTGLERVGYLGPLVAIGMAVAFAMSRRLDLLALGDEGAAVLGVRVRLTRLTAVVLAVLLAAAAVTVTGPLAFVGLCAPALTRLLARRVPGLGAHAWLLPTSAVVATAVVFGSDLIVRAFLTGPYGSEMPTGVVTALVGAPFLIWLAARHQGSARAGGSPSSRRGALRSRVGFAVIITLAAVVAIAATVVGMLFGDTTLLLGDLTNWLTGRSGPAITYLLDNRLPRVVLGVLAGVALAIAGATVQAVCRNPLAEPGIIGVTAGASVGAVGLLVLVPGASVGLMAGAAGLGAVVAFASVYGLAWRGGLDSDRLVLVGVGVGFLGASITALLVLEDTILSSQAMTWLSGSTYARGMTDAIPVAAALVLLTPLLALATRELDLLALDDDTPRLLGVPLERVRLLALAAAAALAATAVAAVGVIGFVGLVAPHAARALVGGRHARVLPLAALLGAALVCFADTVGRTVIAPDQLPAGLMTAMIGAPYFVWLLRRTRV
ncbi:MAG TPA: iron ABC transporter permease [Nocardioidaceae bacterium]|nr:iron ABC transporter permease [Nocardioidaceae bacterium]